MVWNNERGWCKGSHYTVQSIIFAFIFCIYLDAETVLIAFFLCFTLQLESHHVDTRSNQNVWSLIVNTSKHAVMYNICSSSHMDRLDIFPAALSGSDIHSRAPLHISYWECCQAAYLWIYEEYTQSSISEKIFSNNWLLPSTSLDFLGLLFPNCWSLEWKSFILTGTAKKRERRYTILINNVRVTKDTPWGE